MVYRFVCILTTSYAYFDGYAQNLYASRESIVISNTTSSNSVSSGALVIAGGTGFGDNLYAANLYSGGIRIPTENDFTSYYTKAETDNFLAGKAPTLSVQSPLTYTSNVMGLNSSAITSLGTLTSLTASGNVHAEGRAPFGGTVPILGFADQVSRGDTGASRALVKHSNSTLVINYSSYFAWRCPSGVSLVCYGNNHG